MERVSAKVDGVRTAHKEGSREAGHKSKVAAGIGKNPNRQPCGHWYGCLKEFNTELFMETIEKSIEVDVPVSRAYNQWTQFEDFPQFMEGVERVQQIDDKRLHWVADIGGKRKEWDAEIYEQVPDNRVAWRSTSGAPNAGVVVFQPVGTNRTRVSLRLAYEPETFGEKVGDSLGFVTRRIEGDLERFKEFIQNRGVETGAWRGKIDSGTVER